MNSARNESDLTKTVMASQQQLKPINEINTIDLMYNFDPAKLSFSEDVVKRMSSKLKQIKRVNREQLDSEQEGNVQQVITALQQMETAHIDFYA